ncbi:MAG: hypothetical protein SPJ26_00615, partial [Collinsella sp.]|nr:hypothetical protein [Collinsella sp.]
LFNLGIGTGTAIGGAVVSGPGIAWIGFVGGAIAVVGVILAITVMFPAIRRAKPVAKSRPLISCGGIVPV